MEKQTKIRINTDVDLLTARSAVKNVCKELELSVVQTTKLLTAVNEIVRNMLNYANGGIVTT
ncbi:MAG: anti-sigma regulatory factor, partial [Bacteroidota bacterium]